MLRHLLTLCLLLPPALDARAAELIVRIENVMEGGGALMIQVLGSESEFDGGEQPLASSSASHSASHSASLILPATAPAVAFTTTALPAGSYAVRVMQDRNGNSKLDTNIVGMPTEPWGFSNDASGNFGPPTWQDARFELRDSETQTIHLNH